MLLHGALHSAADRPGLGPALGVADPVEPRDCRFGRAGRQRAVRCAGLEDRRSPFGRGATEDEKIEQRRLQDTEQTECQRKMYRSAQRIDLSALGARLGEYFAPVNGQDVSAERQRLHGREHPAGS